MKKIIIVFLLLLFIICPVSVNASDEEITSNVNHVSFNNTNIIGGINGVRYIDSKDELDSTINEAYLPTVCVFKVDNDLNVFSQSGCITITEAINELDGKIIPGFDIDNNVAATNLVNYLKENNYSDCFIISENEEIISTCKNEYPKVSYALDFSKIDLDLTTVRAKVHQCGANVAILDINKCDHNTIQDLYNKGVNVWAKLNNDTLKEIYQGIVSGAIGVVTDKTNDLTNIIKTNFSENSLTRTPLNIAHTGMPRTCPENTIEGARYAYKKGADVIELDIQLTTDSRIAVMHDSTTARTCDKNLVVEESTMAELKELYVNRGFEKTRFSACRIPDLEEYFTEFKDTDLKFFIEIKTTNLNIVPVLKDFIDQYDMKEKVTIITFYPEQVNKVLELIPDIKVCLLQGVQEITTDLETYLNNSMETIGLYNSTFNPNKANLTSDIVQVYLSRGISTYPWTYNTKDEYTQAILAGYAGLTGNSADTLMLVPKIINTTYDKTATYNVGDSIEFSVDVSTYYDQVTNTTDNISIKLIGERNDTINGNKITFTKGGEVNLVIAYTYDLNGNTVSYYTDVITLNVELTEEEKKALEEKEKEKESSGCSSSIGVTTITLLVLSLSTIGLAYKKEQ